LNGQNTVGKRNKQEYKATIVYNSKIKLMDIPLEAYDYVVNGKPAIEWVIERYKFDEDKNSGITNNPNDCSDNPRYIIDFVKRVVRVSIKIMKIVNNLPPSNERNT
jgi:predicted helicase